MWLLLIPPAAVFLTIAWVALRTRPDRTSEAMLTIEGYRRSMAALARPIPAQPAPRADADLDDPYFPDPPPFSDPSRLVDPRAFADGDPFADGHPLDDSQARTEPIPFAEALPATGPLPVVDPRPAGDPPAPGPSDLA